MALTETRPETHSDVDADVAVGASTPSPIERLLGTGDHRTIGRSFITLSLVTSLVSAAGLALAGIDGLSDDGLINAPASLWTSSLVGLVLLGALPLLLGLAINIVPQQVGSPAVAFPRAAALSLWGWLIGAVIFIVSVVLDGGVGGTDNDAARLGNVAMGLVLVAISLGSITVATTVLSHRPLGMGLSKVPLFSWSMLIAAPIWTLTLASVAAHVLLGQISQANAPGLAEGFAAGIAWFLAAPAVYMLAIPVLGIVGDAVAKSSGRRIVSYGRFQALIAAYGVLSFGAWTQTPRAVQTFVWVGFVVLAALPVLGVIGGVADTLRRGKVAVSPGLLGGVLALLLVLGGILAGALQGLDSAGSGTLFGLDLVMLHWAQALFLVGAAMAGALGGLAFWSRRLFGADAASSANGAVLATFLGGGLLGVLYVLQSILARDGAEGLASEAFGVIVAIGAALLALGALAGLATVLAASKAGAAADSADDPDGLTLEWVDPVVADSPLRDYDIAVVRSPYPLLDLRDGGSDEEGS